MTKKSKDKEVKKGKKKAKAVPKKARVPARKFIYKPVDENFKPFFIDAFMTLGKDGVVRDIKATRIKGRPDSDTAKKVDLNLLDPKTFMRFVGRLAAGTYIHSQKRRLPAFSAAKIMLRVGLQSKTGGIRVGVKEIKFREGKEGKVKTLAKKNPYYRALRKCTKIVPGAFTESVPFPSNKELKALLATPEEEGEKKSKKTKGKKKK